MTIETLALSIRQPWAWLIVQGHKPIENRDWQSSFRGPVLIHAGIRMSPAEYEACDIFIRGFTEITLPPFDSLERGGIVGEAEMTNCITHSDNPWFTGPNGFVFRNPKPLQFHRCGGKLGFFKADFEAHPEFNLDI
jgi:hypothetical protein